MIVRTAHDSKKLTVQPSIMIITTLHHCCTQHEACKHWFECDDFGAVVSTLIKHGADKHCDTGDAETAADYWQPVHFAAANAGHAGSAAAMRLLVVDHSIAVDSPTDDDDSVPPVWLVARHACADSSNSSSNSSSSSSSSRSSTDFVQIQFMHTVTEQRQAKLYASAVTAAATTEAAAATGDSASSIESTSTASATATAGASCYY
jgi:hypothetical protein